MAGFNISSSKSAWRDVILVKLAELEDRLVKTAIERAGGDQLLEEIYIIAARGTIEDVKIKLGVDEDA